MHYDLAVIGAGAARFGTAIQAVREGERTLIVDSGTVGGRASTSAASRRRGCWPRRRLGTSQPTTVPWAPHRRPRVDMAALVAGKDEIVGAVRSRGLGRLW
jgi:pyruvate/2-oxoglutarate dehydrogenase complex dihydrolipoamide dehydrogenase (E3) component